MATDGHQTIWARLGQKEQFKIYREEIRAYNMVSLRNVSIFGMIIGAVLMCLSLPFIGLLHLFFAYFLLFLFFSAIQVSCRVLLPRHPALILPSYYVMIVLLLLLTIYMGTVLGPDTNATTFLVVLLLIPQFVTDYPWRLIFMNVLATILFIITAIQTKPLGSILSLDISNAVVACWLSAVLILIMVQHQMKNFERLRQEKDELFQKNRLVNAIPAGIAVFEVRGTEVKQIYTNDGFYRLFEDTEEARLRRNGGSFFNGIHPEDRPKLMRAIQSVIDGKNFITLTCRSMKGDGTYLWVRFASSVDKREGDYLRVYSTYTSMEEEIKSREATQAKSEFLSRMSHDMRTPMNGILGLAALSEHETDLAVLHNNLQRIRESGAYLLSLINDTLDFQRIEGGKMVLEECVVKAQRVLDNILEVIRPVVEQRNIDFHVVNENIDLSCYVQLDPIRCQQILINLLSNAVKFSPEGGTVTFLFGCLKRDGPVSHIYICISDTGIGMSQEFVQNRLFKPFSQESSAVSTQYAGSGLGLSIVSSLVELMGGSIKVESQLGVGTTFTVYLAFTRVAPKAAEQLMHHADQKRFDAKQQLTGKQILLAEDHPLNAEIAKKMLEKVGCQVTWAKNGRECVHQIECAGKGQYDAILMDVRMPVMDGIAAAKVIRRLERADAKTIPIIAVTANAYENDIQNCLHAGMNAHLAKPINMNQLYQTLCEWIGADS